MGDFLQLRADELEKHVAQLHHPLDVEVLVRRTSALLHAGVPLTLLLDLAEPLGPDSSGRFTSEGGDLTWLAAG